MMFSVSDRPLYPFPAPNNFAQSGGPKINNPTPTDATAAISTIPAARSFAALAFGWMSGDARSIASSTAVFNPSKISTNAIVNTITAHSALLIRSHPATTHAAAPITT